MFHIDQISWQPFREQFPLLFRGGPREGFSADVGVGWEKVILDLCIALEAIAQSQTVEGLEPLRVTRIRVKCGCLFFCVDHPTAEAERLIHAAQDLCDETCEACGEWGDSVDLVDSDAFLKTLCPRHALMVLGPGSSPRCDLHEADSRFPRDEGDET